MAPNAEEDLLVSMPRGGAPHSAKERLRPPTYNPEDYAIALRRWGRRALGGQPDNGQNTLPSTCTSSSSGYASATGNGGGGGGGEMTLRQFTSVSELLNKLKADLRLAFPSFVQEFCSPPAEGISLLLETLRGVQLSQSAPPSATGPQTRRPRARRAALDELGCVECLAVCTERCPDAPRILAQAHPGLLALAVCLTSSLNRSRVLALQLLTRVCQTTGGHGAVSEAVSTLRLRYAEGGRFRFLAGALLATKAALPLRVAGLSFLNTFLSTAPRSQTRLYIQAEACEAGLEPRVIQDWLKYADEEDEEQEPLRALLREEVRKWSRHCVDVDALQGRARRAEETCRLLSKKVSALQRQLQQMQLERRNEYNGRGQREEKSAGGGDGRVAEKKLSSSAEDEGISFSERSSSPEDPQPAVGSRRQPNNNNTTNLTDVDQETTIDDVIEELRTIVKDAEDELHDWNQLQSSSPKPPALPPKTIGAKSMSQPSKARECLRSTEEVARQDRGSLKILVPAVQNGNIETEEEDNESAIVPAIIHPQPPRRTPTFLAQPVLGLTQQERLVEVCVDSEEELLLMEDDADSLLSASRLKAQAGACVRREESLPSFRRRRSLGSSLADFETTETILESRRKDAVIKTSNTAPHPQRNQNSNSLNSKQYNSKCANTVQRRTERRKYLRRCQSQEHMDNQQHQQETSTSSRGVIEQIRKFESMNSFDERRSLPNLDSSRLRRSESFHQTRQHNATTNDSRNYYGSKDYSTSSRGGSDSGLTYNALASSKSLDKIDEGLDSLVDIVVSRRQLSCERQRRPPLDIIDDRKYTSFLDTRRDRNDYGGRQQQQPSDSRIFAGRPAHDVLAFGKNRFNAGKYSGNSHPPPPQPQYVQKSSHRHSTTNGSAAPHQRGKVTDMVSGLY
ncbi:uncharacterized protein LOC100123986 isoform X2 [Nasonia vitripennis]|nr:uncharacterized protein LOC100123986 isoform X2 [Nasonia vitripennis]